MTLEPFLSLLSSLPSLSLSLSLSHSVANFTSTCTAVSIMKQQQEAKKKPFQIHRCLTLHIHTYTYICMCACVYVCLSTTTQANLHLSDLCVVPSVSLFSHGLSAISRLRQNRNVASSSRFANLNPSSYIKLGATAEEKREHHRLALNIANFGFTNYIINDRTKTCSHIPCNVYYIILLIRANECDRHKIKFIKVSIQKYKRTK